MGHAGMRARLFFHFDFDLELVRGVPGLQDTDKDNIYGNCKKESVQVLDYVLRLI
jgi:hypothetical protein